MKGNLDLLEGIARAVRPLLDEIVFVGGAIAELYTTMPVLPEVRATRDADALCEAASYVEYAELGRRLQRLGFHQTLRDETRPFGGARRRECWT